MVGVKSAGAKAVKQTFHPSRTHDQTEIYEVSNGDIYTISIVLSAKHNPCSMIAQVAYIFVCHEIEEHADAVVGASEH
jgi:hypothetical protein